MSIWIAKLLGPIFVVLGAHMALDPKRLQDTTAKFLGDGPLVFVSGVLAMLAGLTMVNVHNLWVWDWRIAITVLGWAFVISGAARIVAPQITVNVGDSMMNRPLMTRVAGIVWGACGLFFVYKGYF